MRLSTLAFLAAIAILAGGCGPDLFVRPDKGHEVHRTLYNAPPPQNLPPPDLRGLPLQGSEPSPPGNSGPAGEPPGAGFIWIPGYQAFHQQSWHWVSGGWWKPEPGKTWVPGRWVPGPGGVLYWQNGYWQ